LLTTATLGPAGLTGSQSTSLVNLTQNWNTSGTPTAIKLNVNDTASNASSLLMDLQTAGTSRFKVDKNGYITAPRLYWNSTSYSSIGASNLITFTETNGTSPLGVGAHSVGMGAITALAWWTNNIVGNGATDTFITRRGAANVRLGAADTTGTTAPTAQTLSVQSWASSTNNNQAGANFTITGSQGTGTGAGGNIIFQLAPAGGVSGTTQNALTNVMTLWPTGQAVIGANNPAAALYNTSADSLIATSATGSSQLRLISASATTTEGGWLVFTRTAGGSLTSPTATASGATIGNILFQGYDGTARRSGAQISAITGGLYSSTSSPAYLAFYTTASGSTTLTEQLRIDSTGAWGLSGANYGTSGQVLTSNGSASAPTWQAASAGSGRLLRAPQYLTSGTSYTTPAGCNSIVVEVIGGGAGGSSGNASSGGNNGGGAGGYASKYFAVSPSTAYSYTIGAGGGAGVSGGASTFVVGATTVTANGGTSSSGTPSGGTATNGDINITGGRGGGSSGNTTPAVNGAGGSSPKAFGLGGPVGAVAAGTGYGAGGSGGINGSGASGSSGIIVVWEYS
jgi:hypothetical protein